VQDELDAVADRLDAVAEDLAELGMSALRSAIADSDSDGKRPEAEKRIARARRSVDKAAQILRSSPSTSGF